MIPFGGGVESWQAWQSFEPGWEPRWRSCPQGARWCACQPLWPLPHPSVIGARPHSQWTNSWSSTATRHVGSELMPTLLITQVKPSPSHNENKSNPINNTHMIACIHHCCILLQLNPLSAITHDKLCQTLSQSGPPKHSRPGRQGRGPMSIMSQWEAERV